MIFKDSFFSRYKQEKLNVQIDTEPQGFDYKSEHELAVLQANLTVASYQARRQLFRHRDLTDSIPQSIQHQITPSNL